MSTNSFFPGTTKLRKALLTGCFSLIFDRIGFESRVNPFVPNAPFLYASENIRKPYAFLMFLGGREKVHWKQMG